jgi:hypothetical protein
MALHSYARIAALSQDYRAVPLKALSRDAIRTGKASAARRTDQAELQVLLEFLQQGYAQLGTDRAATYRVLGRRVA